MTQKVPRVVALVVICILHFVHAFSFTFSSHNNFFFSFFNSKGLIYIPKLVNKKYRSPCSFKSERPSYLFTSSIGWKAMPCSRNACALIRLIMWFLSRGTGCPVQYRGITLSQELKWLNWRENLGSSESW